MNKQIEAMDETQIQINKEHIIEPVTQAEKTLLHSIKIQKSFSVSRGKIWE